MAKANQTHPLETLPWEAENHRLPGFPREILLRRSLRQETADLAVQLLQHGILEFGVRAFRQIILCDRNGEYISLPIGEFDVFSGKSNLQDQEDSTG